MRNLLLFWSVWLLSGFYISAFADTIPANNGLIEYTGRIDFSDPTAPRFSYSGVSIRACFTGTSISMILNDNSGQNYYNILLDGVLNNIIKVSTGKKIYKIADGLENTVHEIEFFKRTEEIFGKTQFYGFVVDEGSVLVPIINKREKLIEYIGNSITCGYGNEGTLGQTFGPTTENHYMTYAAFTSRNFNARHLAVSKSGIGIYRNYGGPLTGNADCMTNLYTRIFFGDENPKYSFVQRPDLVCINLGTNDFSTTGGDSARYVSNYFRLIDTLQTKYEKPDIICLAGPMLGSSTLIQIRKYLQFIADSASRRGKGQVYFFEMSQQTGTVGVDYHPTVAQHLKNGSELVSFIKSVKGWKLSPVILNVQLVEARHVRIEFNTTVIDTSGKFTGFSITGNGTEFPIDSAYGDPTNKKLIHLHLQNSLSYGDTVALSYVPGSIASGDTVFLNSFHLLPVQNKLTETRITRGTVSTDGSKVTLISTKSLKKNSILEGLVVYSRRGNFAIDTFSVSTTQLTLILKDKISKTDTVFADYSGNGISGIDEVPVSPFSKLALVNNSTVAGIRKEETNTFSIFPNPNLSGVFGYRIDPSLFSEKVFIEVFNSVGKMLHKQNLSGTEGLVGLSGKISKGILVFKLTGAGTVLTRSIIVN